jgi:hypothetical protein
MNVRIQVVVDNGTVPIIQEVACLERDTLCGETLGLSLEEAKGLLANVQSVLVSQQIRAYVDQQRCCPHCGQPYARKDADSIIMRTLFGKLELASPRLYTCPCQLQTRQSFNPVADLLSERTTPELLYLQTKWSACLSYRQAAALMTDVLPMETAPSLAVLHRHVEQVAERTERELGDEQVFFIRGCEAEWEELPDPEPPITVGIDGGYIHARDQADNWFEVIVGKSLPEQGQARYFGFVNDQDAKPKRRLYEVLKAQGLQMNQTIIFLSDGGDTVREMQLYMNPNAEHLLDWFHITMRLTVLKQMSKGLKSHPFLPSIAKLQHELDSIKWYLWHGNTFVALQLLKDLADAEGYDESDAKLVKFTKTVCEFETYIRNNRSFIPNYGDRYRNGERISTAFVESTVNLLVAKRFNKKQQMRWSKKGAHRLLQVRVQVFNNQLYDTFKAWYPNLTAIPQPEVLAA